MKRITATIAKRAWVFILLLPALANAAENTRNVLDFTPPPSDVSVKFLGAIFGVVDGVLQGTGSQIFGRIFGVFNAAVLVLGGIVIFYTLLVATLNTANEGEVLGKNWSSIWIPIRSAAGIALLLPKAGTGYNLMQIFVMWVVIQGVGAADRIWDTTLDYLKQGGVIIEQPLDKPTGKDLPLYKDKEKQAGNLLAANVCMYGLQNVLQKQRRDNIKNGIYTAGSAKDPGPVPYFAGNIDPVSVQSASNSAAYSIKLPNLTGQYYSNFNGACGTMIWNALTTTEKLALASNLGLEGGTQSLDQAELARAVALSEMNTDMGGTAQTIVRNQIEVSPENRLPLGQWNDTTKTWVAGPGSDKTPLLTGYELQQATNAYEGLMRATLKAIKDDISKKTKFIPEAKKNGWILAGSYYFDLAQLNHQVKDILDDKGTVAVTASNDITANAFIQKLLNSDDLSRVYVDDVNNALAVTGTANDTGTQYVPQALEVPIAGDTSGGGTDFTPWKANVGKGIKRLSKNTKDCGLSLGCSIVKLLYNGIARPVGNWLIDKANEALKGFLDKVIAPVVNAYKAFGQYIAATNFLSSGTNKGIQGNPITAMAAFGSSLLNVAATLWIGGGLVIALVSMFLPGFTAVVLWLAPILISIMVMLFSVGVFLSYYIPLLPYIIFTLGAVGWFIGVIEGMIAAPIVALGLAHPEGQHQVFGQADRAIMLLLNMFLRPVLMVIGFIAGISLSYIGVWLINTGFANAAKGMMGEVSGIANLLGPIVVIVIYTVLVVIIIQKAFGLIHTIPDNVLTWLSGGLEKPLGREMAGAEAEVKGPLMSGGGGVGKAAAKAKKPVKGGGKKSATVNIGDDGGSNNNNNNNNDDGDGSGGLHVAG